MQRHFRSARRPSPATFLPLLLAPAAAHAQAPCGEWMRTPTPNPGNSINRLTSIAAHPSGDAWAVGHWQNTPTGVGPLAIRWNGAAWNQVTLPATSHLGTNPKTAGITIAPNGDVWAVGNVTTTYPTYNLPLLLRYRNETWDFVGTASLTPQTIYPFAARGGWLNKAAAISPTDIWAVGLAAGYGDGGATAVPLALHFDGSTWTDVEVPRIANRHHDLVAVCAIATDDVWAVGEYRNIAGAYRGMTYHYDGSAWSHIHSPIEDIPGSGLLDVVATASNDVWAIGTADGAVVVMRWNGSQWSLMPAPANTGGKLAAVAPNNLWASGWEGYWHYSGSTWTHVPVAAPGAAYVIRSAGMAIIDACDIWSAGFWSDSATTFTLAERLGSSCFANCDTSTTPPILNVADFSCFLAKFAAGDPYANCDNSTTLPVLNVADFGCFLTKFAAGCP
jgi:hypothetical protein